MKTPVALLALTLTCTSFLWADDPKSGGSCCAAAKTAEPQTASSTLPSDSLYQLTASWQDQHGQSVTLATFAGKPVIVSMIFTHCAYACPRIIADLKHLQSELPADVRDDVQIVLASFDTVRDTPERMRAWAREQNLGSNWTLLHGNADAVRELSVLLDIPYVPQPDGSFGHGNRLVLLNDQGAAIASVEGLGAAPAPIVAAVSALPRARAH